MRRAINYSVNRDGLVTLLNGLAEPASGVYNKSDKLFGNLKECHFDISFEVVDWARCCWHCATRPPHPRRSTRTR